MDSDYNNDILDDELIRLVSSNADISNQYVIFTNSENSFFAINVAKVQELIINKDIEIVKGHDISNIACGVAKIRDNIVTVINFDDWLGVRPYDKTDLNLIILTNYSDRQIGIVIKDVIGIQSCAASEFVKNTENDLKTISIFEVLNKGKKYLCKVFDFDKMAMDAFPVTKHAQDGGLGKINAHTLRHITKNILFADDSELIRKTLHSLFDKMQLNYLIFNDGQELLNGLKALSPEDVALIITDLEMPILNGLDLIKEIKQLPPYENIPILVHTNMAHEAIMEDAISSGATDIIKKIDIEYLSEMINKYAI